MLRKILVLTLAFLVGLTFTTHGNENDKYAIHELYYDDPYVTVNHIMHEAITTLRSLHRNDISSITNVEQFIEANLIPHIDVSYATQIALAEHWDTLSNEQRTVFEDYITKNIVEGYSALLGSYNNIQNISYHVQSDYWSSKNRAIVKVDITYNPEYFPITVKIKMSKRGEVWKVYDMVFSGTSIVFTYRAQFGTQIDRMGLEALLERLRRDLDKKR